MRNPISRVFGALQREGRLTIIPAPNDGAVSAAPAGWGPPRTGGVHWASPEQPSRGASAGALDEPAAPRRAA